MLNYVREPRTMIPNTDLTKAHNHEDFYNITKYDIENPQNDDLQNPHDDLQNPQNDDLQNPHDGIENPHDDLQNPHDGIENPQNDDLQNPQNTSFIYKRLFLILILTLIPIPIFDWAHTLYYIIPTYTLVTLSVVVNFPLLVIKPKSQCLIIPLIFIPTVMSCMTYYYYYKPLCLETIGILGGILSLFLHIKNSIKKIISK